MLMKNAFVGALSLFIASSLWFSPSLQAQAEHFFKGKTLRIVVGFSPGGTFDLWARLIAQHMGKHIPGNPSLVVQNMPGAGSMTAGNYIYGVAKPDGLTIGTVTPSLYVEQLMGRKEVQYDWAKFSWIGQPEQTDRIFYIRADTPYKSLEDIRRVSVPPKCGATGVGTASHYWPKLVEDALGLRFNVVAGYGGASDVNLAIEKGEVHCWGGTVQAFFGSEPGSTWAKTGFVRVLIQGGRKRHEKLPDVPTIWELMDRYKTPENTRRLVRVLLAPDELGRPYIGTPGVPPERVTILREAFMKTMNDPELLGEVKKRDWLTSPTSGDELQATAKELMVQPPEVLEQMKKLLAK
jgi:tripartite-type tricarboxylate transporter receptor subunit TctC